MASPAKVTSVESLDAFKASLIVYLEQAARVLDDVGEDVVRCRVWLETDRKRYWQNQIRQRSKQVAQVEQELLTSRLDGMPEAIKTRRIAVNKARLALDAAEDKLARVKHWIRQYESLVEIRSKPIAQLRHWLFSDMRKAVAFLDAAATNLTAYTAILPPPSLAPDNAIDPAGDAATDVGTGKSSTAKGEVR